MSETRDERIRGITSRGLRAATPRDLEFLKELTEDELLRESQSMDMFALVESNRRLKKALHAEETAIKNLTRWLVGLTVILVILTSILVWPAIKALF